MKAFIFDIDNTLYSYDCAHKTAFAAVLDYAEKTLQQEPKAFETYFKQMYKDITAEMGACAAIHNRLIRFQRMMEALHLSLRHANVLDKLYWHTLLDAMEPEPGIAEAMDALRAKGYLIGVGTNMTADWQFDKLEQLGLLDKIDFLVSSEEACVEKPNPKFYALCAKKAGCAPEDCLFIGDSLKNDCQGALQAGMKALLYAPMGNPEKIPQISHFNQLQNLEFML